MGNIKYHAVNIVSVLLFSFITAYTVNQFVRYAITPEFAVKTERSKHSRSRVEKKDFSYYNTIIESSFFKIADVSSTVEDESDEIVTAGSLDELSLLGTVTGPAAIARALIRKKGENEPAIFAVYRINEEITNNVYGYTLFRIDSVKVHLKNNDKTYILELLEKKKEEGTGSAIESSSGGGVIKKTISRAEIKQKVLNNMDNALKGLRAGPYRVNGQVEGFRLITIRPYNILYKLGARNGDVVKRINGKKIDSTEKLYKMWETLKTESRITADIERRGKIITFEYNISE